MGPLLALFFTAEAKKHPFCPPSLTKKEVRVNTATSFTYDMPDDYRIAYVITENNVGPYTQANYYSDGSVGEMGGFENEPSTVPILVTAAVLSIDTSAVLQLLYLVPELRHDSLRVLQFPSVRQQFHQLFMRDISHGSFIYCEHTDARKGWLLNNAAKRARNESFMEKNLHKSAEMMNFASRKPT